MNSDWPVLTEALVDELASLSTLFDFFRGSLLVESDEPLVFVEIIVFYIEKSGQK